MARSLLSLAPHLKEFISAWSLIIYGITYLGSPPLKQSRKKLQFSGLDPALLKHACGEEKGVCIISSPAGILWGK